MDVGGAKHESDTCVGRRMINCVIAHFHVQKIKCKIDKHLFP
jgi:hypothetical protein